MFFQASIVEKELRFGDILLGYVIVTPRINNPFQRTSKRTLNFKVEPYNIEVDFPKLCVVLDPCCDIGGGTISISPLVEVKSQFFDIKYLTEDLTRINNKATAKELMHPATWNKRSDEEKEKALTGVADFGHMPYFIYEGNPLFPEYSVVRKVMFREASIIATKLPYYEQIRSTKSFTTRHRMINFKNIYHINCEKIHSPNSEADTDIFKSIFLRLTEKKRHELRTKMAYYFSRIPKKTKKK